MANDGGAEDSELWSSPVTPHTIRPKTPRTPKTPKTPTTEQRDAHEDPEAALKRELQGVRAVNESLEGVLHARACRGQHECWSCPCHH